MKITQITILFIACALIGISFQANSTQLKASIAIIPGHSEYVDSKPSGKFIELTYLISKELGNDVTINLFPFARSIDNVSRNKADFHLPLIRPNETKLDPYNYYFVEEPITQVSFVLYTHVTSASDNLKRVTELNFDTLRGHKGFFSFNIGEVNSITAGISKVLKGRSGGFIFEQEAVDKYLKENKILDIHRRYFESFDSTIIVSKTDKGKLLGLRLSEALKQLKQRNVIQPITQKIHQPYVDWQPYEYFK